jgi:hypothetical protein
MNLTDEHEVVSLIVRYGFDLGGQQAAALVRLWGSKYDRTWLLPAAIESLHRGRYKVASIEQVLQSWQRQDKMTARFTAEFAEMVLGRGHQPDSADSQEALDESFLDEEIHQFSDQDLAEAHQFADEIGLSEPALDEDNINWGNAHSQLAFDRVPFKSGVASDLTASLYPPSKLRKPGEEEIYAQILSQQPPEFEPPPEVSRFYYRLLEMANTSPIINAQISLEALTEPQYLTGDRSLWLHSATDQAGNQPPPIRISEQKEAN